MSRIRFLFFAIVSAVALAVTMDSAFGIVVVVDSTSRIPFSQRYPVNARQQVRAALATEDCEFLDGISTMRLTTFHFAGDTKSINALLQNLADCPGTSLTVSFASIDHECDWRIVHSVTTNRFNIVVNLKSDQIALESLVIPAAKGPELIRRPTDADEAKP